METKYCKKHGASNHYYIPSENYWKCGKCSYENGKRRGKKLKEKLVRKFGGRCLICGYDKCMRALAFHHVDPRTKNFSLDSHECGRRSEDEILEEAKKCILVCTNCHMEIEEGLIKVPANVPKFIDNCRIILDYYSICPICGKEKHRMRKYCSSKCASISNRKVERPTKEELKDLIMNNSWVSLGKMFGISADTVRKWAHQYGLKRRALIAQR